MNADDMKWMIETFGKKDAKRILKPGGMKRAALRSAETGDFDKDAIKRLVSIMEGEGFATLYEGEEDIANGVPTFIHGDELPSERME